MLRSRRSNLVRALFKYVLLPAAAVLFALEFLIYYAVLFQCDYPSALPSEAEGGQGCNSIDILGKSPNLSLIMFGVLRHV